MIYPNQREAGDKIIHIFSKHSKYVILVAQMQSGKTGTCKYVIKKMLKTFGIKNNECWYICGMNDNDLLEQAKHEFSTLIPKNNILFSKGLQKHNETEIKIISKVIIVDESHYAGCTFSQVDIFLERNHSAEKYLISVSATPMAEIVSAKECRVNKQIVILRPDINYYGIADIFAAKLIFQAASINTDFHIFANDITEEYERQRSLKIWKYCIVRLPNQWYTSDITCDLKALCPKIKFIDCHYANDTEHICINFNDYINNAPKKMTIIWIYNSLRAGKQLNTEHVGLVYDSSNSGTDTTAQALLGRILGYNKKEHKVRCYTDLASASRMLSWITSDFSDKEVPLKSRGVLCKSINVNNWILHVPICITLLPEYIAPFKLLKDKYKNRYPYKNKIRDAIIASAEGDEEFIVNLFTNYQDGKYGGLMILSEHNADRSFREHWEGNYTSYVHKKIVRGFEVGIEQISEESNKFCYVFVNLHKYSKEYGECLLVYKEYNLYQEEISFTQSKPSETSRFNYSEESE